MLVKILHNTHSVLIQVVDFTEKFVSRVNVADLFGHEKIYTLKVIQKLSDIYFLTILYVRENDSSKKSVERSDVWKYNFSSQTVSHHYEEKNITHKQQISGYITCFDNNIITIFNNESKKTLVIDIEKKGLIKQSFNHIKSPLSYLTKNTGFTDDRKIVSIETGEMIVHYSSESKNSAILQILNPHLNKILPKIKPTKVYYQDGFFIETHENCFKLYDIVGNTFVLKKYINRNIFSQLSYLGDSYFNLFDDKHNIYKLDGNNFVLVANNLWNYFLPMPRESFIEKYKSGLFSILSFVPTDLLYLIIDYLRHSFIYSEITL